MASTSLKFTPSGAGDSNRIFTISLWFKRGTLPGSEQYLFECNEAADNNDNFRIILASGNNIIIQDTEANTSNLDLRTNRLFRDTSAWYHLVLEVDTTQGTDSDRAKLYINGVQETSFSTETYPSQNYDTNVSQSGEPFIIGRRESTATPTSYFDGYMAHYHFVDGTAYDADTFGQTESSSGIWKPIISPSVTYGTNGFFLKFQDSSALGDDSSGNTNDFTLSGSGTQTLDTPSNVFATWDAVMPTNSTMTLANGNTTGTTGSNYAANASNSFFSTLGVSQGKWYVECKNSARTTSDGGYFGVSYDPNYAQQGTTASNNTNFVQFLSTGYAYSTQGSIWNGSEGTSYTAMSVGDILGIALDLDNNLIYYYLNGTLQNTSGNALTADKEYFFAISDGTSSNTFTWQANFGNGYFGTTAVASANSDTAGIGQFEYSVPSGYYALCTKNIAEHG